MRIETWNFVYFLGLAVYVAIRGVFGARTKHNEKVVRRVGVSDRVLVGAVFVGSIVLPLLYLFSALLQFADYDLPPLVPWCGTAVILIALWLFWRAHVDLGLNWSITLEMRRNHQLIVDGVYRRIRHPMYTAIFLFAIGQGFLLQNRLAGWAGFVTFALLYLVRMPREEQMMSQFFGKTYRDYMRRTNRLCPCFW